MSCCFSFLCSSLLNFSSFFWGFAAYEKEIECVQRIFCNPSSDLSSCCLCITCQDHLSDIIELNIPANFTSQIFSSTFAKFVEALSRKCGFNCLVIFDKAIDFGLLEVDKTRTLEYICKHWLERFPSRHYVQ